MRIGVLFGDLADDDTLPGRSTSPSRRSLVERGVHPTLDDLLALTAYPTRGVGSPARAAFRPRLSTSFGGFSDDSIRR